MFTLKGIKLNNGATIQKDGTLCNYAKGYQVSKNDLYVKKAYKLTKRELLDILNTLTNGECLGVWIDSGLAFVDISECISTKKQALKIGKQRKQLSVYNWKTGECIAC